MTHPNNAHHYDLPRVCARFRPSHHAFWEVELPAMGLIPSTSKAKCSRRYLKNNNMAQIQTIQTGDSVETRVRGRVFRQDQQNAERPKSKERRRVCVLSAHGARMLESWGVGERCHGAGCSHAHHTRESVESMVREGIMRWIGAGRNVAGYSYGRSWKGVDSGGTSVKVMQLVSG